MKQITCLCEQVFSVDFPDIINLTEKPEIIKEIQEGIFLSCICPVCNTEINTEFPVKFEWPSKNVIILFYPEVDRISWFRTKDKQKVNKNEQVVIGYPELADRISVLHENLNPLTIEVIKYYLLEKAYESSSGKKIAIYFEQIKKQNNLEFRIHGLREEEVAVSLVPKSLYNTIHQSISTDPKNELFESLVNGPYISVQNILFEDDND